METATEYSNPLVGTTDENLLADIDRVMKSNKDLYLAANELIQNYDDLGILDHILHNVTQCDLVLFMLKRRKES